MPVEELLPEQLRDEAPKLRKGDDTMVRSLAGRGMHYRTLGP
jgi:hypothetical protein